MENPTYLHLKPGEAPPQLDGAPFKAVLVAESDVSPEWQMQVSDWLVRSGCRYMLAWGQGCSAWHDSVDEANLARFNFAEMSDDDHVMTTWHENESLQEVFWFAGLCAMHPTIELERTYLIHVAAEGNATALLDAYRLAQEEK